MSYHGKIEKSVGGMHCWNLIFRLTSTLIAHEFESNWHLKVGVGIDSGREDRGHHGIRKK